MELCKSCLNYRTEYDEMCRNWDDESIIDAPNIEKHYCCMYDESIPQEIISNQAQCPYYMGKE